MTQTGDGRVELQNRDDSESRTYLTDLVWGDHLGPVMTSRDSTDTSAALLSWCTLPKWPKFGYSLYRAMVGVFNSGDTTIGSIHVDTYVLFSWYHIFAYTPNILKNKRYFLKPPSPPKPTPDNSNAFLLTNNIENICLNRHKSVLTYTLKISQGPTYMVILPHHDNGEPLEMMTKVGILSVSNDGMNIQLRRHL